MSLLAQAAAQSNVREESLDRHHIATGASTQARVQLNNKTVKDYTDLLRTCLEEGAPWPFPPVEVIREGSEWNTVWNYLTDGFHRIEAARLANWPRPIPALVRPGTQRDAVLAAVGSNATHGLRRTNADKRRAVTMLLQDEEWRTWSDRAIADQTGTTHPFVADVRRKLYPPSVLSPQPLTGNRYQSTPAPTPRKGKDGRTINTSRIGNGRSESSQNGQTGPYASVWQLENGIRTWLEEPRVQRLNITPHAIRDMATRYPHTPAQADLNDYLPEPRRKNEMVQALNNVAAQLEQARNQQAGQSRRDWGILATDWLAAYTGKNGETWSDLAETQIHHANSPCFQAFAKQHPDCPDPKTALRQAFTVLSGQVVTTPASRPDPRPRLRKYLLHVETLFSSADEDIWADEAGNTRMSDLRFLVKAMITDLAE